MQPSETKVFEDFPKVGTFVPNGGLSTMVRPRLQPSIGDSWLVQWSSPHHREDRAITSLISSYQTFCGGNQIWRKIFVEVGCCILHDLYDPCFYILKNMCLFVHINTIFEAQMAQYHLLLCVSLRTHKLCRLAKCQKSLHSQNFLRQNFTPKNA